MTIGRPLLALALAGLSSSAFAQSDNLAARCVQSALNDLGYEAGTVDGIVGDGTLAAFEAFREATDAAGYPFDADNRQGWCIHLAQNFVEAGDTTWALASQVIDAAEVTFTFVVPAGAIERVELLEASGRVAAEISTFEAVPLDGGEAQRAVFGYPAVARVERLCTYAGEGWTLMDDAGNPQEASCDPVEIEFFTAPLQRIYYILERE